MTKHHKPFGKSPEIVAEMEMLASNARIAHRFDSFISYYDMFVQDSIGMKEPMLLDGTKSDRLLLGAMGVAGEGGEILDQMKKCMFHDAVPPAQMSNERRAFIVKEIGDSLWYFSLLLRELGITWRDAMQGNMDKLVGREKGTGE